MPKARDPNRDKAFEIYQKNNGAIDLVKIANQLSISPGTVRGWKSKDQWEEKMNGTFQKNTERSKQEKKKKKEDIAEDVEQVIENPDLTDKQRLFCIYYIRCFNATKAYQKAYGCSYETAMVEGCKCLRKPKIKEEIQRLKQNRLNRELLDEADIFQKYMDIAFADITEYVEFGRENVLVMGPFGPITVKNEKTGKKENLTKEINVVKFKPSAEVDGTLITEIKQGKDGASIKLADKMKALNWLAEHMDLATEEQRTRIAALKTKIPDEGGTMQDDGFLEALKGMVNEVWEE